MDSSKGGEKVSSSSKGKESNVGVSTPTTKPNETESSSSNEYNNVDLKLLIELQDYGVKRGYNPFGDVDKLKDFYENWNIKVCTGVDHDELSKKIGELHLSFLRNMERKSMGEDVDASMDRIERGIFYVSNLIWGENDVTDSDEETGDDQDTSVDPNVSKDSLSEEAKDSSKQATSDTKDTKHSLSKDAKESSEQETSYTKDTKDTKHSSSKDAKESSEQETSDTKDTKDSLSEGNDGGFLAS